MNINVLNAYNNPYANSLNENLHNNGISINTYNKPLYTNEKPINSKAKSEVSQDSLLTKKERTFFTKLFPENSEQIEKHVLFNRNGKVHTPAISKGVIFDGRV